MFTIIKYAIYALLVVFLYYVIRGVFVETPQEQVEQQTSFLNNEMQLSVQSIVAQFNKNVDELAQQSSNIIRGL